MRIAVIQRFLPSRLQGGVGHFTHGLCNALVARGHAVTVFTLDPAPAGARYQVRQLRTPPWWGRFGELYGFPYLVARQDFSGFDLLHAQGDDQYLPRRRPPLVRTLHGSSWQEALHNGWRGQSPIRFAMFLSFYLLERVAARRADRCVAVSRDTCRDYPGVNIVIPNGIDLVRFRPAPSSKSHVPSLLFVGSLEGRKRGRFLAHLFRERVRPHVPEAELWLVCRERIVGEGLRWYGTLSDEALADLYRQAWVLCVPSTYEGFGRPYLEGLASGTAVVATTNPGAREVLADGQYGVVVSDEHLGETLVQVLREPDLRRRYETRGLGRARQFAWDDVARSYEAVYEQARGHA